MTKLTIAIVSDPHGGSTLGLCPPRFQLPDGGQYHPSHAQRWLYQKWTDFIERMHTAAKGGRLFVVSNGDALDGKPHASMQVITDSMTAQRELITECYEPLLKHADKFFCIRGTAAHVGGVCQHEEALAADFGAEPESEGASSHWHLQADFGGILFDFAHHVGGGGRPWTAGGNAVRLAAETVMHYAGNDGRIPQLVFRSHVHRYADSFHNVKQCRAIITPAWQLRTEYGYRVAAQPADVGGIIVTVKDREYNVEVILYKPESVLTWREKRN